jgi:hypothetical protein
MYNKLYTYKSGTATSGSTYGTGVTYDGTSYTQTNTSTTLDATHHYSCNNTTGTCSTVRYYYFQNYYIELTGGTTIEEALVEMLSAEDVNKTNSKIKTAVDNWYQSNMTNYTDYIEDTVYCNDRTLQTTGTYKYEKSGWNPNGGKLIYYLHFVAYRRTTSDLSCSNITDRFSTQNTKAKLTYPVGLLTFDEVLLGKSSSDSYYLKSGSRYWLSSPADFNYNSPFVHGVSPAGDLPSIFVNLACGVRPALSLRTDVLYSEGDGSKDNPYIIETN